MCVHVHVHMCNCRSTVRGQKLTEDVYLYGNPSHFETESLTESGAYWFIWAAWLTGQWTPESDDLHIPCPSPENTCVYVTIPRFYMDRDLNSNPQAFAEHLNHQMTFQAIVQYVRLKNGQKNPLLSNSPITFYCFQENSLVSYSFLYFQGFTNHHLEFF